MKTREFIRDQLLPSGAVKVRKVGDHHLYRLRNGRIFALPIGGTHTELKPYLAAKLRRLLKDPA